MFRRIVRWVGIAVGVLVGLLAIAVAGIFIASESMLNKTYTAPTPVITASTDSAVIARGKYLADSVSVCVSCHGTNLGGGIVVDDPALGRIVAPNLTRGQNGVGNTLSDADMARAIRYGVLPDGHSVRVMPADDYNHLSDADLTAIVSYIRSAPPVDSSLPDNQMGFLGRVLLATGQLPIMIAERIDLNAPRPQEVEQSMTVEYGKYLADNAGCTGCHGPGLSGGKVPGTPPDYPIAANLTPSGEVGQWTEEQFIQTLRTGKNPAGHELSSEMPWKYYKQMSDDELKTIWLFIKSVPDRTAGTR